MLSHGRCYTMDGVAGGWGGGMSSVKVPSTCTHAGCYAMDGGG